MDIFDQNNNHLRIKIGSKKWYYMIVTWLLDTCSKCIAAAEESWRQTLHACLQE
jgi:hypothetical protein